jgi:hypothetical protein
LAAGAIAISAIALLGFIVTPRLVALPAPGGVSVAYANPLGISSLGQGVTLLGPLSLAAISVPLLLAALVALVVRYRSGGPEPRQQIKWVALTSVVGVACQGMAMLAQMACGCVRDQAHVCLVGYLAMGAFVLFGLPVAITIAILRHGLYQIDVIINRTLVYSSLTVALAGVYLGSVLLLQLVLSPVTQQSDLAVAGSTLTVAALFSPARARIQHVVDRRFYRSRYDAVRTIDDFTARLRHELDLDAVGLDLRAAVQASLQPAHVSLWLRPSDPR